MVVVLLANKLKHFVLFIVSIFRRALCCFRRRRRSSVDSVPLTHVGVISNHADSEENWTWDEKNEHREPRTVQDHIELYRKRKSDSQQQEVSPEERLDFFEDMTPRITKQTKVFISTDSGQDGGTSRLGVAESVPVVTGELREWEESQGWEGETLDWDAQEALREKKRRDRERKLWEQQQQKRQEKSGRSLGARVST